MKPEEALEELSYEDTAYGGNCTYEVRQEAIKALQKQIPRKPIDKTKPDDTASLAYENCNIIVCPTCSRRLKLKSKGKYCDKCGKKLDWSEKDGVQH